MITILCQYFALIMMVVLMMVVAEEWLQIMMIEIYLYNLDLNYWDDVEEIDDDQNKLMTTMVVFMFFSVCFFYSRWWFFMITAIGVPPFFQLGLGLGSISQQQMWQLVL